MHSFLESNGDQTLMDSSLDIAVETNSLPLLRLHSDHCRSEELPYDMASSQVADPTDVRPALLQFMIAAAPNDQAVNDILGNYEKHLEDMTLSSSSELGFSPSDDQTAVYVNNVPETVNPVKSTLGYIQVPNKSGDAMHLNLVWKVRGIIKRISFTLTLFFTTV